MMNDIESVAIIDDDESIRRSLCRALGRAGFDVQAFASAREFLTSDKSARVSCVVSDLRMPGVDGLDLQRALADSAPHLAVVFITGHADVSSGVRAMKAGAIDFLEKPVRREDLIEAIGRAIRKSRAAKANTAELDDLKRRHASLTGRERQVFSLVAAGLLNKQIGAQLGVTERTIKQHRGVVMEKMAAESLAELVLMADRLGVRASGNDLSEARGRRPPSSPSPSGESDTPHLKQGLNRSQNVSNRPRRR